MTWAIGPNGPTIVVGDELPDGYTKIVNRPTEFHVWSNNRWVLSTPTVPQEVSRFQARAGLLIYGSQIGRPNLLAEVDSLVNNLAAGTVVGGKTLTALEAMFAKEAWTNATVIRRDSVWLNLLFPVLGLAMPEQLDEVFTIAAGIVA